MLEIHSDRSRAWKDIPILLISTVVLAGILYFILMVMAEDTMAFYGISSLLLLLIIPFTVLGLSPQKIVVDTDENHIKMYMGKWKVSEFSFSDIASIEYGVKNRGYAYLIIRKKGNTVSSIGSWLFREEDVRAVFDSISPYSEEYGFEVKKNTEPLSSGYSEISSSSNDDAPHRIK